MDLGLSGKVALVTSASSGLGKAAAMEFAREGAKVTICGRSDRVQSAADDIRKATGGEVLPVRADVSKQNDVQKLVESTVDRFGRVDILIINAGGPPTGAFLDLKVEDWRAAIELTLMSSVYLCYEIVPPMLQQGSGSIVASQSYSVKQPIENLVLSNSIRLAVIGMMKTLANELGPKGIRVNSINPGWTKTERVVELMQDRARRNRTTVEDEVGRITQEVPLGRMATPQEYGKAVVWLASPAASYIHGHALMVDGGITMTPL